MNLTDIIWAVAGCYLIFCAYKYLFIRKGDLTKTLNYTYKNPRAFEIRTCIALAVIGFYFLAIAIYQLIVGFKTTLFYIIGGFVFVAFVLVNQVFSKEKKDK